MIRLALLALGLLLLPSLASAEDLCPWINKATAFGILTEGRVPPESTAAVTPDSCIFTLHDGKTVRELKVTVVRGDDAATKYQQGKDQCGSETQPLPGIGNEAVTCTAKSEEFARAVKAVGRVRDAYFTVTLASKGKNDPLLAPDAASRALLLASGQVAGNLY